MMLVVKGSTFVQGHGEKFSSIFQILIFLLQVPINEIGPTRLELVHV